MAKRAVPEERIKYIDPLIPLIHLFHQSKLLPDTTMGKEYRIIFAVPPDYNPAPLFRKVPNPIHRKTMSEIYNYRIEKDGFYFLDSLV